MINNVDLSIHEYRETVSSAYDLRRRHTANSRHSIPKQTSDIANIAKSMLILDSEGALRRNSQVSNFSRPPTKARDASDALATLSQSATIGRNSEFGGLTEADREKIGGLEYRSLRLLLKVIFGRLPCLSLPFSCGICAECVPHLQDTSSASISLAQSFSSVGFNMLLPSIKMFSPKAGKAKSGGTY
jgi:hypothetical protein